MQISRSANLQHLEIGAKFALVFPGHETSVNRLCACIIYHVKGRFCCLKEENPEV